MSSIFLNEDVLRDSIKCFGDIYFHKYCPESGFKSGWGYNDLVFAQKSECKKNLVKQTAFENLKKAYDRVDGDALRKVVRK